MFILLSEKVQCKKKQKQLETLKQVRFKSHLFCKRKKIHSFQFHDQSFSIFSKNYVVMSNYHSL